MNFTIETSNHGANPRHVEDYLALLRLLVEAAGHQSENPPGSPGACHIFVEYFNRRHAAAIEEIRRAGAEVIIVATEFLTGQTGDGEEVTGDRGQGTGKRGQGTEKKPVTCNLSPVTSFNDFGGDRSAGHYGNQGYWRSRFENFRACARHAKAIWCASDDPEQISLYQTLVEKAPVVPLPFPHFPGYAPVEHRKDKEIDLFFWGSQTGHRAATMKRLSTRHAVSFPGFQAEALRRDLVARSKICLNLKQGPSWQFPSKMRYWYHLSNRSFLLGEECPRRCELDRYVPTFAPDELDSACHGLLESGEWGRLAAEAHERFAADCPGKAAAEELFDRSFR